MWVEIQVSVVKIDGDLEVLGVPEAARRLLHPLDCRVDPAAAEGTLPLDEWAHVFGGEYCRRPLEPDFFLHGLELRQDLFRVLKELGKSGPFWGIAAG